MADVVAYVALGSGVTLTVVWLVSAAAGRRRARAVRVDGSVSALLLLERYRTLVLVLPHVRSVADTMHLDEPRELGLRDGEFRKTLDALRLSSPDVVEAFKTAIREAHVEFPQVLDQYRAVLNASATPDEAASAREELSAARDRALSAIGLSQAAIHGELARL